MLYGHETISNYTRSNVAIWMSMAFQAGLLNIGGFMAVGSFVSHITGYATLFGLRIGQQDYSHALGVLIVPALFLCGSMVSGYLVDLRLKMHKKPRYYLLFGVMFLLLLAVVIGGFNGIFGEFGTVMEGPRGYMLLALLCLICGIQNGAVTSVSKSVIRTTHLTGITTDLGIGIVRVLNRKKIGSIQEDIKANFMRLGLILFFGFGSIIGAFTFTHFNYRGFLIPVVITGGLFVATIFYSQKSTEK